MSGARHIAITGATGGIGAALTRRFAGAGYNVSAIGRNGALLDELAAGNETIAPIRCDVGDGPDCARGFVEAAERFGPPDSLIAAAAIYPKAFFLDSDHRHLEEVLRINVLGVANSVRAVLPAMLERNYGRVVVVGSLAGMRPLPGSLAYSVSKWTLHSLVRGIAGEIDRTRYPDVLVNEFSPGATRTAMSTYGNDPEAIFDWIRPLVECGPGGPHGRFFQEGREIRIGESWKAAIKRIVLRRG